MTKQGLIFLTGSLLLAGVLAFWAGTRVGGGPPSASAAPTSPEDPFEVALASLPVERESAYQAIRSGAVWEGAGALVFSLRAVPGEDPAYVNDAMIDEAVATLRLAVFAMADLMDDELRKEFIGSALEPATYPTDELVRLRYEVARGLNVQETQVVIDDLWSLASSSHPIARIGALSILASPYYFFYWPCRPEARARLVGEYPDLEITRVVLQGSLYACKDKGDTMVQSMVDALDRELASDGERLVLGTDPVFAVFDGALPDLLDPGKRSGGIAALCHAVVEDPNWKVRYGCLNLVAALRKLGDEEIIEAACRTLAAHEDTTPDVVRAKCLMLGYAREVGTLDAVRYWGEDLLALERIVDPIERTLHEEVAKAVQHYADFLEKAGLPAEAADVLGRLAAKYPNSALAARCHERVQALFKI